MEQYSVGVLDQKDFEAIKKEVFPLFEKVDWSQSAIKSSRNPFDSKVRSSKSSFVDLKHYDDLVDTVGIALELVSKTYGSDFILEYPTIQLLKYEQNDFYVWHADDIGIKEGQRRIFSISINLNIDYTGGGVEVKDFKTGSIVRAPDTVGGYAVFTSLHKHRAVAIESGQRQAITFWFMGNSEQYSKMVEMVKAA